MARPRSVPRPYFKSGQWALTLRDSRTGVRRTVYLGAPDSPEARRRCAEVIAEWEANDRIVKPPASSVRRKVHRAEQVVVSDVILAFWRSKKLRYTDGEGKLSSHGAVIRTGLRILREQAGDVAASDFGPKTLVAVRKHMADSGRFTRGTVNKHVAAIVRIFKHGVAAELVSESVHRALACVEPIQRGEIPGLRESKNVTGVEQSAIDAVRPYLSRQLWAVVQIQLLTGARGGEILQMRGCDIERRPKAWLYRPEQHKNAHRGHTRTIGVGPKGQEVLAPFLIGRDDKKPLFSPAEAVEERRRRKREERITPATHGNRPGTNRKAEPEWEPGETYSAVSYRQAIVRACEKAGIAKWTPHQLRHEAATRMRRALGLEAASELLGHGSAAITDAVYAERDEGKILKLAQRTG